ncbi:sensor histidine kinase [Chryseobacterium aquaeductus]|nr:HAMP domain-containing sensor histidine kinase [Chryseobacterium aquaeductus]
MLTEAVEQKTIGEEDFFKLLPQVKSDAQKNLQTVQDSTAWLKTQYGNFEVKSVKIMVFDLFQRLEENYAVRLKKKNINFHFKGDKNSFIQTDRILLDYILDKILNNAVKYSLPGQDIYFQYFTENNEDIVSVVDFGTGISEKHLHEIFNYGNSVFNGTAGEIGAGLSLKIVKNFVSLLHGNIKIVSSENKGTTVSIFLPKI